MGKPLQFSMWRMFGAVAFFCLAAWLAAEYWSHMDDLTWQVAGYCGVPVSFATGFGTLVGRPIRYAAWGIGLAFLVGCIASI
jgi:hypothetical protein